MFHLTEKFQNEAGLLAKRIISIWPCLNFYLFEKLENGDVKCFYSSSKNSHTADFSGINPNEQFSTLFKNNTKNSSYKALFDHYKIDALTTLPILGKRILFLGSEWPEIEKYNENFDLSSFAFGQLYNHFYLADKLQKYSDRTQQVISEVSVLHEISRAFEGSKSLDNLLTYLVEKAKLLMRTESASLMLHIEKSNELEFKVVLGPKSEEVKPFRLAMGKGIAGWVAQNREPILIPNAYEDPRFDPSFDKRSGYITRSILCVPMIHKGKTIGVMTVLNRLDNQPFIEDDKTLMLTFASQAALAIENARLLQAAIEKERLDKELQVASEIQNLLIPQTLPDIPGLQLSATYLPCKEVSGDFYDIIKIDDSLFAFVVADVAGKGIPGAMLVSTMQATLSAYLEVSNDLVSIVDRLNRSIMKNTTDDRFITFFIGLYNAAESTLTYVNAGHNPPFILRNNEIIRLNKGGIFIGSIPWKYESDHLQLEPDDVWILFTDGLVEAMDLHKNEFGDARLEQTVRDTHKKSSAEILESIKENVNRHISNSKLDDDFTLVVVKKTN
ncbi:MAG: SpoIIE family protein phosphatase [Calditrichae bacterium]|nr:SpoIIE family protein phosphatase [Calditrichota bacterium]MCB9057583.1 SpoIIE family protein phosphatase [Calditrichia bacterium]